MVISLQRDHDQSGPVETTQSDSHDLHSTMGVTSTAVWQRRMPVSTMEAAGDVTATRKDIT